MTVNHGAPVISREIRSFNGHLQGIYLDHDGASGHEQLQPGEQCECGQLSIGIFTPGMFHNPGAPWVVVPRELLVRVDSVCSLVAHRGLDTEAQFELEAVALEARRLYEEEK